jgi:monofunctional biosynthetic peptidoglycan transglycosylase
MPLLEMPHAESRSAARKGRARRLLLPALLLAAALLLAWPAYLAVDVGRYLVWPDVSGLADENPETTAFMELRQEQLGRDLRHQWADLERISPHLRRAVTIAEDDAFWQHQGFDLKQLREVLDGWWRTGEAERGASTITQQLAKNLWLSSERSLTRKLKEAVLAWRLERALPKERILELYLNVAEWGPGVFGAQAAARHWFGIPAAALSPAQAARLAAVLPCPRYCDPTAHTEFMRSRERDILGVMEKRGLLGAPPEPILR